MGDAKKITQEITEARKIIESLALLFAEMENKNRIDNRWSIPLRDVQYELHNMSLLAEYLEIMEKREERKDDD